MKIIAIIGGIIAIILSIIAIILFHAPQMAKELMSYQIFIFAFSGIR